MPKAKGISGAGGRPLNPVWGHFNQIHDENGKLIVKCKQCNQEVSAKADRMVKHISQNCLKLSKKQNNLNIRTTSNFSASTSTSCSSSSRTKKDPSANDEFILANDEDADDPQPSPSSTMKSNIAAKIKKIQPSISNFVMQTTSFQKQEIDVKIARFFYACNISFAIVENKHFVDLISALRPGYKPPSRKNLANDLLEKVTAEIEESAVEKIAGKTVTLMQDGWSNVHNDPVIANSIFCNGKSVFLSAIDCGKNKKTSEYCTNLAREAKIAAEAKYGCIVKSFVSDNEQKMLTMRQNLETEDIIPVTYGCASHYLNILGKNITTDSVMASVVKIQKFFRNHHIPGSLLKEYADSVKPQIPGETRWNSQIACLKTFITNRPFYLQIVDNNEDEIDNDIKCLVNNLHLYKEAKNMYNQLEPVAKALMKLQHDNNANIADACEIYLELLQNEQLNPHFSKVKCSFDKAMTPVHFLAHLMNPKYKGEKLSQDQEESAREYLQALNPKYLQYTIQFKSEDAPFPKTFFSEDITNTISPALWWKNLSKTGMDAEFLQLMEHLQGCPASSASLERIFSNFSFIQNKIRNRLSLQRASKLVFCYMMLKSNVEVEDEEYEYDCDW